MVKIIKKVKLNAPKSSSSSSDPTKGTQENPYTQEEFYAFEPDKWPGGWVEGMGYVLPMVFISSESHSSEVYPSTSNWYPSPDDGGDDGMEITTIPAAQEEVAVAQEGIQVEAIVTLAKIPEVMVTPTTLME